MPKRRQNQYAKVKNWAKSYYQKWRQETTYCPAFKQEVLITRIGWHHLVGSRFRTKAEKIRRFKTLPLAKKLIKTATTYQEHRYHRNIHFYALIAEMDGRRIKVILSSNLSWFWGKVSQVLANSRNLVGIKPHSPLPNRHCNRIE